MKAFKAMVMREWRLLLKDKRTAAVALLGPLVFALIIGIVYSEKKITGLRAVIVDTDNSALSREITSAIVNSEPFTPGGYAASADDFEELAAAGEAQACFVFPPHFERDLKSGRGAAVEVLVDSSNLIAGNVAVTAASSILSTYSVAVDMKKIRMRGTGPQTLARRAAAPIGLQTRSLFNPAFNANYANFLVVGFLGVAVQLAPLLAASRAGTGEFAVIPGDLAAGGRHPVVLALAKCCAYAAVIWPLTWLTLRIAMFVFELPMRGSELLLSAGTLWFVFNLAGFGFAISCFAREALFATEICALLTMPNFLLSGFSWPVFAMPGALKLAACLLPMNPFVFLLRKIALMGAGPAELRFEFALLAAWTAVAGTLAVIGASRITAHHSAGEAQA
jgi:ABC-2 type transport system permease protein